MTVEPVTTAADWIERARAVRPATEAFIDGRFVPAASGRTFDDVAGRDGSVIARVAESGAEDVDRAVSAARRAFEDRRWSDRSPADRKRVLLRLAELIRANLEGLALLESLDVGKPIREALKVDVPSAATTIQWYAEAIDKVYGEVGPTGPGALSLVTREPVGVVAAIVPWNYPLIITAWKLGAALATGNSVVLKPASQSPLTALRLAELASEAGLPDGVLNVIPGPGAIVGPALARHPGVDKIAFTGSTEVGKSLMRAVGESDVKGISLELGGKSPQVVLADVGDIDAAASAIGWGIFYNSGQTCNAGSRLVVHRSVREPLVERIAALGARLAPGEPLDPRTRLGAIVDERQLDKVLGYVTLGRQEGARLVSGGGRVRAETGGFYMEPTILDGVDNSWRVAREEIFGPVLTVTEFEDEADAIRIANDTAFGLAAGLWTRDVNRAHRLSRAIRAGVVYVNTFDTADVTVPFGGYKQSGFGRDKSLHALDGYTQLKTTWFDLTDPGERRSVTEIEGAAGARRRHRGERGGERSALPQQRPWSQPRLRFPPTALLSADEIEGIHEGSLRVLEEIGMDFLEPEARDRLAAAGADVEPGTQRVRFDRAMVTERIKTAPSTFTLHARNPDHHLVIGGDHMAFGSVASPPNVFDLDRGRRVGNRADNQNLIRLSQMLNVVHFLSGYPVEPIDIHPSIRHLDAISDVLTLTDKPIHAYSLGRQRNLDALEMVRIVRGVDEATLEHEPSIFTVINSSSPLRLDSPMLQGILEFSSRNQIIVMTPFTLAGAMAPVTIAGALAEQNAEALAGIVLTQVVRPGSPVVYGGFTSNVDMQSGAPAFGTPEYMRAAIVGGQLARRYGLPYRSSNVSAANALDAQAAYESVFALWGAIMGGVNLMMHGAGWMEGGLHAGYEKMILDAELLGMVEAFLDPLPVDEASLAFDAMLEVGPGGHFFGAEHTQSRFRTAFHKPMLSDWRNFESWEEAGSPEAPAKANKIWKAMLAAYEPPPIDPAAAEELEAFVARRKGEGGVPTDY